MIFLLLFLSLAAPEIVAVDGLMNEACDPQPGAARATISPRQQASGYG